MRIDPGKILEAFGVSGDEVHRIRLGPGVVGNTSTAIIVIIVGLAVEAFALKEHPTVMFGALAVTFVLAMTYLIGTWWFAARHPDLALMGGAELLQLRHMQMAASTPEIMADKTPMKAPSISRPESESE